MSVILVNNRIRNICEVVPIKGELTELENLMYENDLFLSVPVAVLDSELQAADIRLQDEKLNKLLKAELPCTVLHGINFLWRRYGCGPCDLYTKLALALLFPSTLSYVNDEALPELKETTNA